ncbi:hypothetical protein V8C44DRAFT_334334 [Trichoderma aethiopicum]
MQPLALHGRLLAIVLTIIRGSPSSGAGSIRLLAWFGRAVSCRVVWSRARHGSGELIRMRPGQILVRPPRLAPRQRANRGYL